MLLVHSGADENEFPTPIGIEGVLIAVVSLTKFYWHAATYLACFL